MDTSLTRMTCRAQLVEAGMILICKGCSSRELKYWTTRASISNLEKDTES